MGSQGATPSLTGYLTTTAAAATYLTTTGAASTYATQTTVNSLSTNLTNDAYGFWYYPYLAGWVHGNGAAVNMQATYVNNAGTLTATRNSTGNYTISWTTSKTQPYVLVTPYWQGSASYNTVVGLVSWTSTSFTAQLRTMNTATAVDGDFMFIILA